MAHCLIAFTALMETKHSFPGTHTRYLKTSKLSVPGDLMLSVRTMLKYFSVDVMACVSVAFRSMCLHTIH